MDPQLTNHHIRPRAAVSLPAPLVAHGCGHGHDTCVVRLAAPGELIAAGTVPDDEGSAGPVTLTPGIGWNAELTTGVTGLYTGEKATGPLTGTAQSDLSERRPALRATPYPGLVEYGAGATPLGRTVPTVTP